MIFQMPSLKELLVELRIDLAAIEAAAKFPIDEYQLTFAEATLVYEGATLGVADCRISKRARGKRTIDPYNFCISGELLELLLMPGITQLLFPKGKLTIIGASIYRHTQMQQMKRKLPLSTGNFVLDLPDRSVNIDLWFKECTFGGGVNLQNTKCKTLCFQRVTIGYTINSLTHAKESFCGMNLQVNGNLIFTNRDKEARAEQLDLTKSSVEAPVQLDPDVTEPARLLQQDIEDEKHRGYSKYEGDINLRGVDISKSLQIEVVRIAGALCCDDIRADRVELDYVAILNEVGFRSAKIAGLVSLYHVDCYKAVDCYNMTSDSFHIVNSLVQGFLSFYLARIGNTLACWESEITGAKATDDADDVVYAINGRGCTAGSLYLNRGLVAGSGVNLSNATINGSVDISRCFILPVQGEGIAVNMTNCTVRNDLRFYPGTVCFGSVVFDDAVISGNLILAACKFIQPLEEKGKFTISAKNTKLGKSLRFAEAKDTSQLLANSFDSDSLDRSQRLLQSESAIRSKAIKIRKKLYDLNDKVVLDRLSHQKKAGSSSEKSTLFERAQERYFQQQYKDESFIAGALDSYGKACSFLELHLLKDREGGYTIDDIGGLKWEACIVVGEMFLYGIRIEGQADFSGALLYGMDHASLEGISLQTRGQQHKSVNFPNALTLKFANVTGELFLNEGPRNIRLPFRSCGEVNLHSSRLGQFFISPSCGLDPYSKWKIVGTKYGYIYGGNQADLEGTLEQCDWFYKYQQSNDRQPYEELAAAYLRAGDDSKARNVLLRAKARNRWEQSTLQLLRLVSRMGVPHYKSLCILIGLLLTGWLVFQQAASTGAILSLNETAVVNNTPTDRAVVEFSPFRYSLQNLIPFINTEQKNLFSVSNQSNQNFFSGSSRLYIDSGRFTSIYLSIHSCLSVLFFAMFIIGITRIIKRT